MKRGIRIFTEAKTLDSNQDLKINGALVSMLKRAGFQVKSFKATKKGYNEMWSGEFKTKNAILPMSVNKYGSVFYQDTNIGRIDKSSKIISWMKAIKRDNKWIESIDEAITIPIEVGDTVLGGKFKNKRIVVKDIGKNEKGDITINGKPLMKYRLIPQEK